MVELNVHSAQTSVSMVKKLITNIKEEYDTEIADEELV
jgi:hypothetical protein